MSIHAYLRLARKCLKFHMKYMQIVLVIMYKCNPDDLINANNKATKLNELQPNIFLKKQYWV
jgi:hypothetical protein